MHLFSLIENMWKLLLERKIQLSSSWKWAAAGPPRGAGTYQTHTKSSGDCSDAATGTNTRGTLWCILSSWAWTAMRNNKFRFEWELYLIHMTRARRIPNVSGLLMHLENSLLTKNHRRTQIFPTGSYMLNSSPSMAQFMLIGGLSWDLKSVLVFPIFQVYPHIETCTAQYGWRLPTASLLTMKNKNGSTHPTHWWAPRNYEEVF